MPAQGAYDDVIEQKVALGGGAVSLSFLIGQIRPGRCDVYSQLPGGGWTLESGSSPPSSKGVVNLSPAGAALKGGKIGAGFKIVLLKDGGDYHAECELLQGNVPVKDGKIVFDGKGTQSVVWLWATFQVQP